MDNSEHTDLFTSPSKGDQTIDSETPASHERPQTPANQNARFDAEEAREAALSRELEGVRNINQVIEGVIATLDRAKGNMNTVSNTVDNASALLNTWTRILSQTEHNQRLILNPNWKGASQDLADIEGEALQKQQAAERRAAEEERRREEVRRRAEEEERQRQAAASATTASRGGRGARGRGRGGLTRGGSSSYSASGSTSSSTVGSRSTPGVGRGFGSTRVGRSRGVR